MKKIGLLMEEIGFKKDAPERVKEAFIKHLIKTAYGVEVTTPTEKREIEAQLSFDFGKDSTGKKTG